MATRPNFQSAIFAAVFAIAFPTLALAGPLEDQLVTRSYKLDIARVQKLPETTLANRAPPPTTSSSDLLRALFSREGITFPTNLVSTNVDSLKNEKAFYFNERTGELHLRATRRDIPKFEKYLEQLSLNTAGVEIGTTTYTRIQIETFLVEIPLPNPPALLTLDPEPVFTRLTNLTNTTGSLTNLTVLTTKTYLTNLAALRNSAGVTVIEQPPIITTNSQQVRVLGPEFTRPTLNVNPSIPTSTTLIIRADSDVAR